VGWLIFLLILFLSLSVLGWYLLLRALRIIARQDEFIGTVRTAAESYHASLEKHVGNELLMDSPEVMNFHRTAKAFLGLLNSTWPEPEAR
jgi:hypothetical protein